VAERSRQRSNVTRELSTRNDLAGRTLGVGAHCPSAAREHEARLRVLALVLQARAWTELVER
jgi:hypothetical protein